MPISRPDMGNQACVRFRECGHPNFVLHEKDPPYVPIREVNGYRIAILFNLALVNGYVATGLHHDWDLSSQVTGDVD